MINIEHIAEAADVIIDGYAFDKFENGYRVINLNNTEKATVFLSSGEVIETTMDDIELAIVNEYFKRSLKFMVE